MRILFICKRQYTGKDLIDDRFGRYWQIPLELSRLGHEVLILCLSYRNKDEGWRPRQNDGLAPDWYSLNAGLYRALGFLRFAFRSLSISKRFKPDLVVAGSDTLYGILGHWLCRRLDIPFVYDLYDNYAAFAAHRLPFVAGLYRRALEQAVMVICVSQPLAGLIRNQYRRTGPIELVNNGVTDDFFDLSNKNDARQHFDLPLDNKLIGVVGAISESRGIGVIFEAFRRVRRTNKDINLVMAGPVSGVEIPDNAAIVYLGELPHNEVPTLLRALDLAIIPLSPSPFCDYCFPLKFLEAMASEIPVIAADVGVFNSILTDYPSCIYNHDEAGSLVEKILLQLNSPKVPSLPVASWQQTAEQMEALLVSTGNQHAAIKS